MVNWRVSAALFVAAAALTFYAAGQPAIPEETIEILGPDRVLYAGRVRDRAELHHALYGPQPASFDDFVPDQEPLRLIAPETMPLGQFAPLLGDILFAPRPRVNLSVLVGRGTRERETTIPILWDTCYQPLSYYDGEFTSGTGDAYHRYVWVWVRIEDDGPVVRGYGLEDQTARTAHPAPGLPPALLDSHPELGSPPDLAALCAWFDELSQAGAVPVLCLDWRRATPLGTLVDRLIAAKAVLGKRVLLGPPPGEEPPPMEDLDPLGGGEAQTGDDD